MKVYQRLAQLVAWDPPTKEWEDKKADELEGLEYMLPSGSGFDAGTQVDLENSKPNRVVLHTAFHHMDEYGGYCGWTNHDVIVTPSLTRGFDIRITGRNTRNDIKSYIAETFDEVLAEFYLQSRDTESRLRNLAEIVDHFLHKENTWSELKAANKAVQDIL